MSKLYQCRKPLTKTAPHFIIHDTIKDTIAVYEDKFPAIVHMHEKFGSELKSQWSFPTTFANSFIWDPNNNPRSRYDKNIKQFIFTSSDMTATNDTKIFSFIKDTRLTENVPTDDAIIASASTLGLRGLSMLSDAERKQVRYIATWLSKTNPEGYTEYLAYYPSNEIANYVEVYGSHWFDVHMTISNDLVLAVAGAMGMNPTFRTGNAVKLKMRHAIKHVGGILLPQKLPASVYAYSSMHLYLFSDRFDARKNRSAKTERKIYVGPSVEELLASYRERKNKDSIDVI